MSRIRIRAKPEPAPPWMGPGYPRINGRVTSWPDIELVVIDDDDLETPIMGVTSIKLDMRQGTDALVAHLELEVLDLELDLDVIGLLAGEALPVCIGCVLDDALPYGVDHFDHCPITIAAKKGLPPCPK